MSWMWKLSCYLLLVCSCKALIHAGIPPHLQDCYRHGGVSLFNPRRLDVMLTLLKKLETSSKINLNLRLFTSSLLRKQRKPCYSLRLDGIEKYTTVENDFILPYRASAFQFLRFKLLMDYFLPNQPLLNAEELLTREEKCLMHRMLSSTVRRWDRGHEKTACVVPIQHALGRIPYIIEDQSTSASRILRKCPVEEGVVQTEWGTIAAGVLIAALSSALAHQRVQVSDILTTDMFADGVPGPFIAAAKKEWMITLDDVSNVLAATLAGDLAEVVVHQGPKVGASADRFVIGTHQGWNDTLIPRELYIYVYNASQPNAVNWQFTDSEILAGIDGLILGDKLLLWVEKLKSLRLTQVIDMYYSDIGVIFDTTVKACNRKSLFSKVFDRQQLYAETVSLAHLMSLHQLNHYVPLKDIQAWTEAAMSAFSVYLTDVISRNHRACEEASTDSILDMVIATDSAWDGYQAQQFMSWLAQAVRLDDGLTTISLLNGNTGAWIVPPVHSIVDLYDQFKYYEGSWTTRLNVPEVLNSVVQYSLNKTLSDIAANISAGPRTLVLLISPVDHPSGSEIKRGKSLMTSLRTSYFDVFFAYLSQDLSDFDLEHVPKDEFFLSTLTPSIQDVITAIDSRLIRGVIPQKIVGTHCPLRRYYDFTQETYADYLPPFHGKNYRIHPFFLRERPVVHVNFRNDKHGRIKICTWRGDNDARDCQYLIEGEMFDFKITNPCRLRTTIFDLDCPPINFMVAAKALRKPCEDEDCQHPNLVRYYIKHSGLKCLRLQTANAPIHRRMHLCVILLLKSVIYIYF